MKRALSLALCVLLALLSGCRAPAQDADDGVLTVLATTYPVYCFAAAVADGAENVAVTQMITDSVSCLHDYTLTTRDMRAVEAADVLVLSGAGLEDFMSDALDASDAPVIDCSESIALLPSDEGGDDPHIWLDPDNAAVMVENLAAGLAALDPDNADVYAANAEAVAADYRARAQAWRETLSSLSCRELITFHDGFAYFAKAFDLTILCAIEEEEGSEASAREVRTIIDLVNDHALPAVFTEVNGSDATAQAISRETGAAVYPLATLMSLPEGGAEGYLALMEQNVDTILLALGG